MRWTYSDALKLLPTPSGARDVELFKNGSLIVELYAPRGHDPQQPHMQDELYIVQRGSGMFVNGAVRHAFSEGDVLFVPAGVPHRFEEFSDDFATWVVFYGDIGGELALTGVKPKVEPTFRNDLLALARSAYLRLENFLDGISDSQATDLHDAAGWAVKDHVVHLALWQRGMTAAARKQPRWEAVGLTRELLYSADWDASNDILFQRHRHRSFNDARWMLHKSHAEFMQQVASMSYADVLLPYRHFQPDSDYDKPILRWLWGDSGEHFDEHLPWMQKIVGA